jgi:hypothetical protein
MQVGYPSAGSPEMLNEILVAAIGLFVIGLLLYGLMMLADCQDRRFPNRSLRRKWTLIILLLPVIGAFIYRRFGQRQGVKPPPAFPRYY